MTPLLDRVPLTSAGIAVAAAAVGAFLRGASFGALTLLAAALAVANLVVLRRAAGRLVAATVANAEPPMGAALVLIAKFGAIGVVLYLLIVTAHLDPLAIALGFSVVPAGIFFESLRANATSDTTPQTPTAGPR
ncbi:MAG: ATP synthase subunit I [Myxococcales bacterium]|nr:ATP synthase subunit I [Myxococcales bacterium]MCB9520758.1 ATP synthase subunit I [Myxococcales bacterium]MCB9533475.1 ATP synthase subunit I [Myxococcales bacterium]